MWSSIFVRVSRARPAPNRVEGDRATAIVPVRGSDTRRGQAQPSLGYCGWVIHLVIVPISACWLVTIDSAMALVAAYLPPVTSSRAMLIAP